MRQSHKITNNKSQNKEKEIARINKSKATQLRTKIKKQEEEQEDKDKEATPVRFVPSQSLRHDHFPPTNHQLLSYSLTFFIHCYPLLPSLFLSSTVMSSTMESKSNEETSTDADGQTIHKEHVDLDQYEQRRVSSFDVRPSVAGIITDSDGNLDEKKAVAALSQTREQNKHMWIACFVLIGVVFILIAANIGTSVAVARLTRQLNVNPITGMATIPGSDYVVMQTSTARYSEEVVNFHSVPTKYLSTLETVDFADGNLSFDVKGYARMSNETILLIKGGSLVFDMIGLKNVTGDENVRLFSCIWEDMKSSDLDGRKLFGSGWNAAVATATAALNNFAQAGSEHVAYLRSQSHCSFLPWCDVPPGYHQADLYFNFGK